MNFPLQLASIFTDIPEDIIVFFHDSLGLGWGPAIILLTVTIRLVLFPISFKQIRSMRAMQELQPELKALQEKYKDDRPRQQQEMMRFYQEKNINPLASCLPLLLQMPVFLALYFMLKGDSFKADVAASADQGFLFIDSVIQKPDGFAITAVLMVLFVGTQLLAGLAMSMRGQGLEGPQRFIVFGLPFLFAPFVVSFPAGLSVYWITTNVWTFAQQQVVYSLLPPAPKKTPEEIEAAKPPPPPPRKKKKRSGKRR